MSIMILSDHHPYMKQLDLRPSYYDIEKEWRMVWRDFNGVKQDRYFKTESEAIEFAENLKPRLRIVDEWYLGWSLAEMNDFWPTTS